MVEFEIRLQERRRAEVSEHVHASIHTALSDVVRVNGKAFRVTGWRAKVPGSLTVP